jgi:hypothetical protein
MTVDQLKRNPTLAELASNVDGGTAMANGIQVTVNGASHIVQTYTDPACTTATATVDDTVMCIGNSI